MKTSTPSTKPVRLVKLDRFNWEEAANLQLTPAQEAFMPSNLFSIAQSKFDACTPLGIYRGETAVGFAMYCNFNKMYWISRIMIDAAHQHKGLGTAALATLIKMLQKQPDCAEVRTSVSRQNTSALQLFLKAGFKRMESDDPKELVLRLP